jgi:hypothetical protein
MSNIPCDEFREGHEAPREHMMAGKEGVTMRSGFLGLFVFVSALSAWNCGNSGSTGGTSGQGGASAAGRGGGLTGASGRTAMSGTGGYNGSGSGGYTGGGARGGGVAGQTGAGGMVAGCTPGVTGLHITDCGYPMMGGTMLASVVFNESTVLEGVVPSGGAPLAIIRVFYSDEHAMTLGVRQVVVKQATGTMTMTDFPVSPLTSDPGMVTNPMLGTTMLTGDNSGLDVSLRPMWPALFITDTTSDPNSRVGDWQQGGVPVGPKDVFGSWKGAVRVVDKSVTPPTASITPDADPMMNGWNLGPGADPVPMGLMDAGFGAEARFEVPLQGGHSYRLQVMVHDGDQRKVGGDSGEACVLYCAGGTGGEGGAGGSAPPPMCPAGSVSCGGGIDPGVCPTGTVCVAGCCVSSNIIP